MTAATTHGDDQVLTFRLGEQSYCVSIDHLDEIVDYDQDLTTLPETKPHVEGVIDLRGRTTTIVDPKALLEVDEENDATNIIVFGSDSKEESPVGWIVDEVFQVIGLSSGDIDENVESELAQGVVRKDGDEFVVWLDPDAFE